MADKLVSMKLDKSDREITKPMEATPDLPVYPWGLQVRLDEHSLDKLGIDTLPKVDSERMLIARVKVVGVSANEQNSDMGKQKHKSVELQITEMCLEDVPASKDAADELYTKT